MTDLTQSTPTPQASETKTIDIVIANSRFKLYVYNNLLFEFWKKEVQAYTNCEFHLEEDSILTEPSRIPMNVIVYTHEGVSNSYYPLKAVRDLTDPNHPNYRPDIRFVVNIDYSTSDIAFFTTTYQLGRPDATTEEIAALHQFMIQTCKNPFGPESRISPRFRRLDFIAPKDMDSEEHLTKYLEMLKQTKTPPQM